MSTTPVQRAFVLSLALAATPAAAQIAGGHALVLTNHQGPGPACELLDVDPGTGAVGPVGRFPSDALPGLAVTVDPVRGDAVVVLDAAPISLVVRVALPRGVAGAETVLAGVSGPVTDVAVALDGDVYCTTGGVGGAVYEIPRAGGVPLRLAPTPFATAIATPNLGSGVLTVALSGDQATATEPGVVLVDVFSRRIHVGPHYFQGHRPLGITGIRQRYLPFAHAFVDEGGNMWLLTLPSTVRPFGQIPALPPGGTQALTLEFKPLRWVALGNAAHPYLKTLPDLTTYAGGWTNVAGPLPGDPVDFALQLPPPRIALFGKSCRTLGTGFPLAAQVSGSPQLGSTTFAAGVIHATPGRQVLLAFGRSDLVALGSLALPLPLPGGCQLLVGPDVTAVRTADGSGSALLPLPIPADPALLGVVLLLQGLELAPPLVAAASSGIAIHIGP